MKKYHSVLTYKKLRLHINLSTKPKNNFSQDTGISKQ